MESSQPTPTVDLAQFPQTEINIDGLSEDWKNVSGWKEDPADDQTADTPDIAGAAAQNNLTHFYTEVSFHSQTPILYYILFVDVTERDWDYQIMLDPITGRATISPFSFTLSFEDAP